MNEVELQISFHSGEWVLVWKEDWKPNTLSAASCFDKTLQRLFLLFAYSYSQTKSGLVCSRVTIECLLPRVCWCKCLCTSGILSLVWAHSLKPVAWSIWVPLGPVFKTRTLEFDKNLDLIVDLPVLKHVVICLEPPPPPTPSLILTNESDDSFQGTWEQKGK